MYVRCLFVLFLFLMLFIVGVVLSRMLFFFSCLYVRCVSVWFVLSFSVSFVCLRLSTCLCVDLFGSLFSLSLCSCKFVFVYCFVVSVRLSSSCYVLFISFLVGSFLVCALLFSLFVYVIVCFFMFRLLCVRSFSFLRFCVYVRVRVSFVSLFCVCVLMFVPCLHVSLVVRSLFVCIAVFVVLFFLFLLWHYIFASFRFISFRVSVL